MIKVYEINFFTLTLRITIVLVKRFKFERKRLNLKNYVIFTNEVPPSHDIIIWRQVKVDKH